MWNTFSWSLSLTAWLLIRFPLSAQEVTQKFVPLIAESQQRREAAQKSLLQWKDRRNELAQKKKIVEKRIHWLAAQPGIKAELKFPVPEKRLQEWEIRLNTVEAQLKAARPVEFTTLAQFLNYDRLTDERKNLHVSLQAGQEENLAYLRRYLRRVPAGKELADEWETLRAQVIEAANEATMAQNRRDSVFREEGSMLKAMQPPPPEPLPGKNVLKIPAVPPPDATERLRRFAERNSPAGITALARRFFGQMNLTLPGLENVQKLVGQDKFPEALDAYRDYFFRKLMKDETLEGDMEDTEDFIEGGLPRTSLVFSPPGQAEVVRVLQGYILHHFSVKGKPQRLEWNMGEPGAIRWVFIDPKKIDADPNGPLLLEMCRQQGYPGQTGVALLHSYALGGPRTHMLRWCAILDDWTMNWQQDVERTPLSIRDYTILYVCRIQETRARLKLLLRLRPDLAKDLPATTLARWLMALNEEYLATAIRLGRNGLYNFRIMALNSMIPTSLQMREFHAHQWALREGWRQVDNNFVYKIRRDGANFEFANDGHENTDQSLLVTFRRFKEWNAQPDWLEPFWDEEFLDNFRGNVRYRLHNIKQDGYCYRLSARDQRHRYIGQHPEYRLPLLAREDESRRRAWKVHHAGKPEDEPRIFSEGMAFQGYYYLRSGWNPEDYFLYFQSIGQPILSGREDNTGFSLYGNRGLFLLAPAPTVDGRTQNIHFGLPKAGGKADFYTYGKPDVVRPGRFHAGDDFDFVEGTHDGVYQFHRPKAFYDVFGSYGYESSLAKAQAQAKREGKEFRDEPIKDVRQTRQILAIRGPETYIVTDLLDSSLPHQFTQNYTIYTPVRNNNLKKRLQLLQEQKGGSLIVDSEGRTLTTRNPGWTNLQIRHIGALPMKFTVQEDKRPGEILAKDGQFKTHAKKFEKRDQQHTEEAGAVHFSQKVAATWQGQGSHVLVTLVNPQKPTYTAAPAPGLKKVTPLAPGPDLAGFQGEYADGTGIAYLASPRATRMKLGPLEATATTLLLCGNRGLALGCSVFSAGGKELIPAGQDFTFCLTGNGPVLGTTIHRPIPPVVIEPGVNVFIDALTVTMRCPASDVEIRYTLDGTKPTPKSLVYTGPFTINKTCRVQARAFRKGITEDIWQQDGTHATVVTSGVFRREPPIPALRVEKARLGLKYEYFEGIWTDLMVSCLTKPAQKTGQTAHLLDIPQLSTTGAYGLRYAGFLDIPHTGVYTLYAPREYLFPDIDCAYELRVFVAGKEWYPAGRWHGHGNWSIALEKGKHPLQVAFVDCRRQPHVPEFRWAFPQPEYVWGGKAPEIMISGPNLAKQRIPETMLYFGE